MARLQDKQKSALKKALIILLSSLLAFVLFSMAFSAVLFRIIFARDESKNETSLLYADLDREVYKREEIFFPSGKNALHGWLFAARGEARALLLFAGGAGSSCESYLSQVVWFIDHGFAVITFDVTGSNHSQGLWRRGLPQAKLDLEAAIDYVTSDASLSRLPLLLYGHSLGGYAVGASLCEREGIAAAVCVCAFERPSDIMLRKAKDYMGAFTVVGYPFMHLENFFLFGKDADCSAKESIDAVTLPVLIVKASDDTTVPEECSVGGRENDFANPNASVLTVTEEGRNRHSNLWLTAGSAKYLAQTLEEGGEVDRAKANVLDEDFMNCLYAFYTEAIRKQAE